MYRIIAADARMGAILEKAGSFFFSWGPSMYEVHEKNLLTFYPEAQDDIEEYVGQGFIRHVPPTEVKDVGDWPKLALEYEARVKKEETSNHA